MRSPYLICLAVFAFPWSARAQDLFDAEVIHTIEIQFTQSNWDHLLDSMALAYTGTGTGEGRLIGTVTIDGEFYDSCGVRYKGNSTYDPLQEKNPLNIDLNEVIAQDHHGTDKIKLANGDNDPSLVREVTFYEIVRNYMHAPRASYAKVWINGDYRGLYVNTEDIGNEFLDAHFGESDGTCFKCDPRSFVLYGDNSNLAYHPDSMAYDTLYDMKSDFGLAALQDLTYQLEFAAPTIDQHLDVDRTLWYHALSNLFVHLDSYYAFAHNYYVYKDKNGRWNPILWDVNMAFGGLVFDGINLSAQTTTQLAQLNPFHQALNLNYRPLVGRILLQPLYLRAYLAHYRTLMEEMVDSGVYLQRAAHWHALIDSIVQYEPYPIHPYSEFAMNVSNDVGTGFSLRPGLEALMTQRSIYLDTLPGMDASQPTISNVSHDPPLPAPLSTATITCEVTDALLVLLGIRESRFDRFVYQVMYDDGAHNDGGSGDGTYGAQVTLGGTDLQYCIYAENDSVGRCSPPRAEHEYHTLLLAPGITLNEAQASNSATMWDQDGEFDDWIELFNNGSPPVDLNGYYLSDDPGIPDKWAFPDTSIAPGSFLIVWADEDGTQSGLHASFKIAAAGEPLLLSDANGNAVNEVLLSSVPTDATFGRYPNGTGPWAQLIPTFSTWNSIAISVPQVPGNGGGKIYPVPSTGLFTLELEEPTVTHGTVQSADGRLVGTFSITSGRAVIDLHDQRDGLYFVKVGSMVLRGMLQR